MKEVKFFELTTNELLKILQDKYNKDNGTNHSFALITKIPFDKIQISIVMWDKDEKYH